MSFNKTYAVFGLGRYGLAVAKELSSSGADVIAVDIDEAIVEDLVEELPVCKCADVTDMQVLKQLGISNIDTVIIAMANRLEASVMALMLCKDAGVKEVIMKCSNETHKKIFENLGADSVVFPENESGKRLAKNLLSSGFLDIAAVSEEISIVDIATPKKWVGKSLRNLDIRKNFSLNVIALTQENKTTLVADPDAILSEDTRLVIIGNKSDIEKLR